MTIRKISRHAYLFVTAYGAAMLCLYRYNQIVCATLGTIQFAPDDPDTGMFAYGEELWSSTIWTTRSASSLALDMSGTIGRIRDLNNPLELVYEYGGTLKHDSVIYYPPERIQ